MKQIIRLTEADLHKLIKESAIKILSEMNENDVTPIDNDYITDVIQALNKEVTAPDFASSLFDGYHSIYVHEGKNTIIAINDSNSYEITFYCSKGGGIDDEVEVESIIMSNEDGEEVDMTESLKQPVEEELSQRLSFDNRDSLGLN